MDFINDILEEKGGDLLAALTGQAGFEKNEAEVFLPEAGRSVVTAMASKADDLDLSDFASSANVGTVLQGIDIRGLSNRTGLTPEQGHQGLATLLPLLLGFLGEKGDAGSLASLLGKAKGLDDIVDGLSSFGKIF